MDHGKGAVRGKQDERGVNDGKRRKQSSSPWDRISFFPPRIVFVLEHPPPPKSLGGRGVGSLIVQKTATSLTRPAQDPESRMKGLVDLHHRLWEKGERAEDDQKTQRAFRAPFALPVPTSPHIAPRPSSRASCCPHRTTIRARRAPLCPSPSHYRHPCASNGVWHERYTLLQ